MNATMHMIMYNNNDTLLGVLNPGNISAGSEIWTSANFGGCTHVATSLSSSMVLHQNVYKLTCLEDFYRPRSIPCFYLLAFPCGCKRWIL